MLTTIICTSLRGYFGCCALHGAATPGLIAALSQIANWRRAILIIDGTKTSLFNNYPCQTLQAKRWLSSLPDAVRRRLSGISLPVQPQGINVLQWRSI